MFVSVLKIILKSSWLRDALSELDPSCEKLIFIGNPPMAVDDGEMQNVRGQRKAPPSRPMLRIQATGGFGSTEVWISPLQSRTVFPIERLLKIDYPNDREVLETFECLRNVNVRFVASFPLFPP